VKKFEWLIAGRYLRARRKEGAISIIAAFSLVGIALGVATLIIVMSVMNGFREDLMSRILGLNGHLLVQGTTDNLADYDEAAKRAAAIAGVLRATPILEGQVMANGPRQPTGALVRGIEPVDLRALPLVADHMVSGSLDDFGGDDAVLIGNDLALKLGLAAGDDLQLISPKPSYTPLGSAPRMRAYRIIGTFSIGMYEYDSSFIFMPMAEAQRFFRFGDRVSGLEIVVDDPDHAEKYNAPLLAAVGGGVRIVDWRQINSGFFTALQVERNVMFIILTLIILVAAFNIISSLIMLVKDKNGDIAILRTMGTSRASILRIFFLVGASIGVVGTFAGTGLGLLFCAYIEPIRQLLESLTGTNLFNAEVYFLSQLPASVDPIEVTVVVVIALLLSFLATFYPSWRAARLDPVEALRYE